MRVMTLLTVGLLVVVSGCKDESPGTTCGDGVVEGDEVCDASSLRGETCFTRAGLAHGELGCSADCASFDTSDCHLCGNGVFEGPELCEGDDLQGANCVTYGYDGGTLSCTTQCELNTSLCYVDCGNGTAGPGEECDGADLAGATCESVTSLPGTLGCTAGCTFDTTACQPAGTCGDGTCNAGAGENHSTCPADCVLPTCPPSPDGSLICISGRAHYFVEPTGPQALLTAPIADPQADANDIRVQAMVYDPLGYATNPSTLPMATAQVDPRTGAFIVTDVPVPATGFLSLMIDDWPGSGVDEFVLTGVFHPAAPGVNIEGTRAFGILSAQNTAWTAAIGDAAIQGANNCVGGNSLWDCGTWIGVFGFYDASGLVLLEGVVPRSGVGTPHPEIPATNTFYLEPGYATFRQPTSLADSRTNQTGTVFMPGGQLSNFMGTCFDLTPDSACETQSYEFNSRLGGAMPNAFMVQLHPPIGFE